MTTHDATPDPMEDPDRLARLFGEVFDLVDETVDGVTDDEVDERLREVLAEPLPECLDELGRLLAGQGWRVAPLDLTRNLAGRSRLDEAHMALRAAWEQVEIAQAVASSARRDAEAHTAAAVAARQQAAEVTAGARAYVDEALDRAEGILAEARKEAAQLVATAEQQAEEVVAAARARAVPAEVSPVGHVIPRAAFTAGRILLIGAGATGSKTTWLTQLNTRLTVPDEDHCWRLGTPLRQPAPTWSPHAAGGAALWSDLAKQVTGLLTDPGGAVAGWTGASAEQYRHKLATWNAAAAELREAFRAVAGAWPPVRPPAGSYRRSVRVRFPWCDHERLDVDLCVLLAEPDVRLCAHHGGVDSGLRWQQLCAMPSPLRTCTDAGGVDGDLDAELDVRKVLGRHDEVRVVKRAAAADRYVVVEAKRHAAAPEVALRVPASTPMGALLMVVTHLGSLPDWPPLAALDELGDLLDDRVPPAAPDPLALDGSGVTPYR